MEDMKLKYQIPLIKIYRTFERITGQAGENEWNKGGKKTIKISVLCDDEDGSGCVKETYTKTFTTQMEKGKC